MVDDGYRYGHKPINRKGEEAAAARLADMVREGRIVLPMSAGHMVETTAMHDVPRQHLASTIVEFSRGWQMDNPLHVRRAELAGALRGEPLRATDVFGLGHDRLLSERLRQPKSRRELPALAAAAFPRAVNASSIYATLIDPARIENDAGRAAAEHWAQIHADLSAGLAGDGVSREQIATVAHGAVLTDLASETVAIAGPARAIEWAEQRAREDVTAMPFLGRYRGVIGRRLGNPSGPWRRGDLTDIMYLGCAAGYGDVVVGEKRTIADLASLRGVTEGAVLSNSLADAVAKIESRT